MAATHTIMKKSLAKALMESGMQHFDAGGIALDVLNPLGMIGGINDKIEGGAKDAASSLYSNYGAQLAPTQNVDYTAPIQQAYTNAAGGGVSQFNNVQQQQQSLANTLLAQSQGAGPNPAQAALAQSTGQNVANQAALMAGQRGAGANVGLMARQAAMQGANTEQQSVGQAATLQAQQQLAAQQALAQQQAAMAGQNIQEQGVNANLFATAGQLTNSENANNISNYAQMQGVNAKTADDNAQTNQKLLGGLINGGGGIAAAAMSRGGKVQMPDHLKHISTIYHGSDVDFNDFRSGGTVPGKEVVSGNSKKNDIVPAMLSAKEVVLPKSVTTSKEAPSKAAEFMRHLKPVEGMEKDKDSGGGYEKVAKSKKDLETRVAALEKALKAKGEK